MKNQTCKIVKKIAGFSETTTYETGLSYYDAVTILNAHKKITGYDNASQMEYSFENENNQIVTYSIEFE